MGIEIERKFMVTSSAYKQDTVGVLYRQGYLAITSDKVVRVRVVGTKGFLTIKGPSIGNGRLEYEYEIPVSDAQCLIPYVKGLLLKNIAIPPDGRALSGRSMSFLVKIRAL